MEIERKFTVAKLPDDLDSYEVHRIEQAYLNVRPAIRVRQQDDVYYMTYKGIRKEDSEGIGQTEYNMELDATAYEHLCKKADGNIITKKRYIIPLNEDGFDAEYLTAHGSVAEALKSGNIKIELDVFEGVFAGRILAEVEFPDEDSAAAYNPASWFKEDVTGDPAWSNAHMSAEKV
ncbi:MAG: CYTH domain-containing protein [Butyrivibrio sp.]|nr:CYTH domain-containing protein [Butyrivibrio sp.]